MTLLAIPPPTQAVPPLPSSLYGTLKLNNTNLPDGTLIEALIKDKVVAYSQSMTYQGDSVYALDIPGDDTSTTAVEGGVDGDAITFKIGGILVDQTGVWRSATNVKLDLTASSTSTPLPPQPTATPPAQTPLVLYPPTEAPLMNTAPATGVHRVFQTSLYENALLSCSGR